jgi:cystathionine beta-lyase
MPRETQIISAGRSSMTVATVNPPLQRASTVLFESLATMEAIQAEFAAGGRTATYGIANMPLTNACEDALLAVEGGHRAMFFPSGLAAVTGVLLACLSSGDHLLMVDSCYGPTRAFCLGTLARFGVETTFYEPTIGANIAALLRPNTRVVYVESPGSLTFDVQDVPAISAAAHAHGAWVVMDNAWATGLYFDAFNHGVDIVVQPATKYHAGHSDLLMGAVVANQAAWPLVRDSAMSMGQTTSPDDLYLLLRSLRTLPLRLAAHQAAGLQVARWLAKRPEVERVLYPALTSDPGYALWQRDFKGATGLMGVELKPAANSALAAMIDGYQHFGLGYSWGGYESLVMLWSNRRHDPAGRAARPWVGGPLLRYHVGLESVDDLIADLDAGFTRLNATAGAA